MPSKLQESTSVMDLKHSQVSWLALLLHYYSFLIVNVGIMQGIIDNDTALIEQQITKAAIAISDAASALTRIYILSLFFIH